MLFTDCLIDGKRFWGYTLNTGYSIMVALTESVAKSLQVDYLITCQVMIVCYGNGRTQVLGETTIQLEVDLAKAEVQASLCCR